MKYLVLVFCFLVVGCTSLNNAGESSQNAEIYVGIKNGNLIYQGKITEASNNAIFSLFNDAEFKPSRLVISSNGGEIDAGMDLGRWVKDNKLDDVKFKTFGCGSAIASSSLATEWLKGKSVDDALKIDNMDIVEELALPPVKIHCSILAEDAIKAAIDEYKSKQAK